MGALVFSLALLVCALVLLERTNARSFRISLLIAYMLQVATALAIRRNGEPFAAIVMYTLIYLVIWRIRLRISAWFESR